MKNIKKRIASLIIALMLIVPMTTAASAGWFNDNSSRTNVVTITPLGDLQWEHLMV